MSNYHITQEQVLEIASNLELAGLDITVWTSGCVTFDTKEALQAFANAVLDKVLGEQWQPIDTVPVNESVLMLRMGKYGRCGMADGYKQENGIIAWPYVNKEPTHWMPLPSAPRSNHERFEES